MLQRQLLFLSFIVFPAIIFAQVRTKNYRIHISETPITIQGNLEENWTTLLEDNTIHFENAVYALLQFNDIPTEIDKKQLTNRGIELISYVPNLAWIAKVNLDVTSQDLTELNVRNVIKLKKEWKTTEELRLGKIPSFAGNEDHLTVRILFLKNSQASDWNPIIDLPNLQLLETDENRNWVLVEGSLTSVLSLLEHPLVHFIEFSDPPIENDGILDESQRAISTYLSRNPGKNYFFDGSGVKIGVDEGGIFDTLQDPNVRTRLDRGFENGTSVSNHKTGVGMRMAGAGNIDPTIEGTAFGADLYSGGLENYQSALELITIVNRSYGWGCSSNSQTYSSSSETYDNVIRTNSTFMISHSAGNAGGSECYAGSVGWGNITGLPKMAKNIFAVGSSSNNGTLTGFSSRGPAKDGRILPNLVAPGPGGTSHASPNLSGVYGQLNQAYRFHNNGAIPHSGLLKAILMNTTDDMLNPGPDFKSGYGHVNARRAYEVIRQGLYLNATATQGSSNVHTITVPPNVKELKVMVYWVDWEATPGIVTRALVNDLDMVLQDPNAVDYYPWVLNPTLDSITLNDFAVRAIDTLNNAEQVTIANPVSGTYQLSVSGSMVPQGPQDYFVTYEFVVDEIIVTHPHGGEKLVPGDTERIRWDACDSAATFDLSFSSDNGSSWNQIASGLASDSRYFDWTVPSAITKDALIKVERGQTMAQSDTNFSILNQAENLELIWSCADSSLFIWDDFPNADGYVVYRIVGDYMDSVAFSSTNSIVLNGLSLTDIEYVSIAAIQNGVTGRRIIAIERPATDLNCVLDDLGSMGFETEIPDVLPSCMSANVDFSVSIRNWGVNTVPFVPIAYQLNGGAINRDTLFTSLPTGSDIVMDVAAGLNFSFGSNSLLIWTDFAGDGNSVNDTISKTVDVFTSTSGTTPLTEDFDGFSTCSTSWDCELVNCTMQNGWYNLPNGQGDDIDWRTHTGATGTGGTGPSSDHTSGLGNYVYLESSGPCVQSTARLYSPCIDLAGVNAASITFWYYAFGNTVGELHVDAIADGELVEDIIAPVVGSQGDLWIQQAVDLSQFSGQQLVVVIRGSTGNNFYSDLAIDDINIETAPIAQFSTPQTQLCTGQSVNLANISTNADSYEWNFVPNTVTYDAGTNSNSVSPQVNFTNSGTYTVQLIATNSFGSDTTILVDYVTVLSGTPDLIGATNYCASDSVIVSTNNNGVTVDYLLNGVVQTTSTNSSYHFASASDGDTLSLVYQVNNACSLYSNELIISVQNVSASALQNGSQLEADPVGAQYQWIDCGNNNAPISGATNQTFAPSADGEYAVIVTENNCSDTSNCLVFSTASIDENSVNFVRVYPNPTSGEVTLTFENSSGNVTIDVYNALGKRVSSDVFPASESIDLTLEGASGIFALLVRDESGLSTVVKVIKK